MDHGHGMSVRRGNHVDLLVILGQGLLQNHHGENGRTRGNVTRAHLNRIGGNHSRTCVALGRTHGAAGLKGSRGI